MVIIETQINEKMQQTNQIHLQIECTKLHYLFWRRICALSSWAPCAHIKTRRPKKTKKFRAATRTWPSYTEHDPKIPSSEFHYTQVLPPVKINARCVQWPNGKLYSDHCIFPIFFCIQYTAIHERIASQRTARLLCIPNGFVRSR